ncbi:MAG TPA: hypothetical protein VFV87_15380, partial [Pirellulaceae bacterium]|nr:hypothetical protein [Pirellulaceae bacterium]
MTSDINMGQLREKMWDLVYGLLEPAESQALISRIKSDPQAARLYAEVRLQADLVGYAAQVEDSSLVLSADHAARETAPAAEKSVAAKTAAAGKPAPASLARSRSAGGWLAGLVAAALLLLIGVGLMWPQMGPQTTAFVVIDIEAPRSLPGGLPNKVPVKITNLEQVGQPAEGEVAVLAADGSEQFRDRFDTDDLGWAEVEIPGHAMQRGAKLRVEAVRKKLAANAMARGERDEHLAEQAGGEAVPRSLEERESLVSTLTAELPVREEPKLQYFLVENPVPEAGQTNRFALWNLRPFSATPAPAQVSGAAIESLDRKALAEPMWAADADGVVVGEIPAAQTEHLGDRLLALKQADGTTYYTPIDSLAKRYYDEATRQNRHRAAGLDQLALLRDKEALREQKAESKDATSARESIPAGAAGSGEADAKGSLASGSVSGKKVGKELAKSLGQQNQQDQPEAAERSLALAFENQARGENHAQVQIPAKYADKRLLVRASIWDEQIAEKEIRPEDLVQREGAVERSDVAKSENETEELASRSYGFILPKDVSGPVKLQLFDLSSSTPELVDEQTFVRQSSRK